MRMSREAQQYADPYLAGFALGLVLLASFVLVGRGLGASGAFATVAAQAVNAAAPAAARANPFFADRIGSGVFSDWLVVEVIGVIMGAWISARLAGRARVEVERGPSTSVHSRLRAATMGGIAMGVGAVLARGCTSGQALTGGALLSVGSWLFIAGAFGAAYAVAFVTRRSWT
jgi:uncharacterized membrane protein YedE/YeeE